MHWPRPDMSSEKAARRAGTSGDTRALLYAGVTRSAIGHGRNSHALTGSHAHRPRSWSPRPHERWSSSQSRSRGSALERGMSWCASVPWQPRRPGLPSDRGAPGSLVGTTFATFGCVRQERAMSTQITSPGASPRSKAARPGYAENCQHPAISAESCCSAGLAVAQGSAVHYQCRAAAHHHGGAGQRAGPGRDLRWSAAGRRGPPARRRKGASPGPGCPAGRCRLRGTPGGAAAGGTWTANRKEEALSCPA